MKMHNNEIDDELPVMGNPRDGIAQRPFIIMVMPEFKDGKCIELHLCYDYGLLVEGDQLVVACSVEHN